MEGFYGLEVHAGPAAVKAKIPEGCIFRLMQVALPAGASEPIALKVSVDREQPLLLLTLDPKQALYHSSLDCIFNGKQGVSFIAEGAGAVHLAGYIQPAMDADDDFFDDDEGDEDGLEDDEDYGSDIYFGDDEEEEEEKKASTRGASSGKTKKDKKTGKQQQQRQPRQPVAKQAKAEKPAKKKGSK